MREGGGRGERGGAASLGEAGKQWNGVKPAEGSEMECKFCRFSEGDFFGIAFRDVDLTFGDI